MPFSPFTSKPSDSFVVDIPVVEYPQVAAGFPVSWKRVFFAMTSLDELIKETLFFIAQKGWTRSHQEFFSALVMFLGERLGVEYALVDELLPGQARARTVGLYAAGKIVPDVEYDLRGTPCENVIGKSMCCYPRDIQRLFPEDRLLVDMSAESYLGIPLWDSKGKPIGLIAVMGQAPLANREQAEAILQMVAVRCAHELERMQAEVERRKIETELLRYQKLESLGSLAGGVAHDMNNVLTAIMGIVSVLHAQFETDPAVRRNLDLVLRATERGRKLVKGLTDFARDRLEDAVPINLNELLVQEAELLNRTTFQRIQVVMQLEEPLPLVLGEPSSLSNVLMNLCVNSIDAMPDGGRLKFGSRSLPGGGVEVHVEDTGQGMTPEVMAKALDPFFTTKPVGKGTGLGLSVVFGAIKAHGGTVEIDSEPGKGTRISLRFPSLGLKSDPIEPAPMDTSAAEVATLRVLLVDDEALLLESISSLFRFLGHHVEMASSGSECLDKLKAGLTVDLVVLDQNMPGLTGIETLGKIRALHPSLPVLLSSGFVDQTVEDAMADYARLGVLRKPFGIDELNSALRAISPANG